MVLIVGLASIAAPALAQTSAEQLNAAELQHVQSEGPPARSMPPMPVVQGSEQCPPGYYWEPAGYASHAKWRPAHCAPN
jgi:hypothetical protein